MEYMSPSVSGGRDAHTIIDERGNSIASPSVRPSPRCQQAEFELQPRVTALPGDPERDVALFNMPTSIPDRGHPPVARAGIIEPLQSDILAPRHVAADGDAFPGAYGVSEGPNLGVGPSVDSQATVCLLPGQPLQRSPLPHHSRESCSELREPEDSTQAEATQHLPPSAVDLALIDSSLSVQTTQGDANHQRDDIITVGTALPVPNPAGTKWATKEDWNLHGSTITRLYAIEEKPLREVMDIMKREHNFNATYFTTNSPVPPYKLLANS